MPTTYRKRSASTTKRSAKYVKLSDLEQKYHFTQASPTILANSTNIQALGAIPNGTGANQKIGYKVRVKSIEVYGSLGANGSAPLSTSCALVLGKPSTASTVGDYVGPFPTPETASKLAGAINGGPMCGGGPAFHFKHTFSGSGMLLEFDREAPNAPQNFAPQIIFTNPSATNQVVYFACKVLFTDA